MLADAVEGCIPIGQLPSFTQSCVWHWLEQTLLLLASSISEIAEECAIILPSGQTYLHQLRVPKRL